MMTNYVSNASVSDDDDTLILPSFYTQGTSTGEPSRPERKLFMPPERPQRPPSTTSPPALVDAPLREMPLSSLTRTQREQLASDVTTPEETLFMLARDTDRSVRWAAYINPAAPFSILDHACRTARDLAYEQAAAIWLREDTTFPPVSEADKVRRWRVVASQLNWQWRKAACTITVNTDLLECIASEDTDPRVLDAVARNVHAPISSLRKAVKILDKSPFARQLPTPSESPSPKDKGFKGAVKWFLMN